MLLKLSTLGAKGINSDLDPWDLPPEFLSGGNNFRVESGGVTAFGGHINEAVAPSDFSPGYIIFSRILTGEFYVLPGKDKIYSYAGGSFADITPAALAITDEYGWSGCLNGYVTFLNNSEDFPIFWNGSGIFSDLPWNIDGATTTWRDNGYSCDVMRTHKNYLFALSLHEPGTTYPEKPDSFRWSHPADENGIPFTWDETNPAGLAGIQSLGGDGGKIIDGLSLRDSFVIYSAKAINILDLSGDEFIWRRRELSTTVGILSKDCVVEVKGLHYILTAGDIVVNDGNNVTSIAHNVIRKRLSSNFNTSKSDRAFVVKVDRDKEVWFCVPEGDSDNASVAYIYNWRDQSWSIRSLPQGTAFIASGFESSNVLTWDDSSLSWGEDTNRWTDDSNILSFSEVPYGINNTSYTMQLLDTQASDTDINTLLERTDLPIIDQVTVTTINRIYPHVICPGQVNIQVGSQDLPGGAVRWKPSVSFNPNTTRKVDVRTTGALHAWRISSVNNVRFRLSGVDIDYAEDGIR